MHCQSSPMLPIVLLFLAKSTVLLVGFQSWVRGDLEIAPPLPLTSCFLGLKQGLALWCGMLLGIPSPDRSFHPVTLGLLRVLLSPFLVVLTRCSACFGLCGRFVLLDSDLSAPLCFEVVFNLLFCWTISPLITTSTPSGSSTTLPHSADYFTFCQKSCGVIQTIGALTILSCSGVNIPPSSSLADTLFHWPTITATLATQAHCRRFNFNQITVQAAYGAVCNPGISPLIRSSRFFPYVLVYSFDT